MTQPPTPSNETRTVVLTGVGRTGQVGEAVARMLAADGARVIAVDRSAEEAEARAAALRGEGLDVRGLGCDLADAAQVAALAGDVAALSGGRVQALVHAAGGFGGARVGESEPEGWHRQITINLTTAYLATRAFLPLLRPARGAIVYFASAAALPGAPVAGVAAYAAAKGGVLTLMRAVAAEEQEHGVRANAVAPTAIRTAKNVQDMGEGVRYVEREEVAAVVRWLCSEEARRVSGQVIALA